MINNDKYIKTKIKQYGDKINTNIHGKKVLKNTSYKCLSLIMLDSAIKVNKRYYPQTLLEEYKWKIFLMMIQTQVHEIDNESDNDETNEQFVKL